MRPCSTVSIQIVALSTDGAAGLSRDRPNVVRTIAARAIAAGKYFFRFGGGSLAISKDISPIAYWLTLLLDDDFLQLVSWQPVCHRGGIS